MCVELLAAPAGIALYFCVIQPWLNKRIERKFERNLERLRAEGKEIPRAPY